MNQKNEKELTKEELQEKKDIEQMNKAIRDAHKGTMERNAKNQKELEEKESKEKVEKKPEKQEEKPEKKDGFFKKEK
jgi:hypothetical protein